MALLAQSFRATLPQTNNQLQTSSNTRNQATIQDGRVVVQNVQGRQNQRYFAWGNGAAGNGGAQNRDGNANVGQENGSSVINCMGLDILHGTATQRRRPQRFNYFKGQDAADAKPKRNGLYSIAKFVTQSVLGQQIHKLVHLNASILSEVHILENAIDHSVSNQDEHEIHNKVQPSNVIDSTSVHMGNSNVIPYEQYLSVNDISVVPSCASFALNSVCVSPVNDAIVPRDPIAIELKIYKEQIAIYEQRAKFELTKREQRMDDQMRMLIQNRNKTEENLKKELHSFKLQLKSTMENNKIIEETVTTLKQEFKQKESKFLTDFSNLKHLNDKLKNKLHS
ncbi:hypothetical protein Tco_0199963 [Tanacetum coccineum]